MRFLCWLGIHRWRKLDDQLGSFGMSLEWFTCWECMRCLTRADCLRWYGSHYQVHARKDE